MFVIFVNFIPKKTFLKLVKHIDIYWKNEIFWGPKNKLMVNFRVLLGWRQQTLREVGVWGNKDPYLLRGTMPPAKSLNFKTYQWCPVDDDACVLTETFNSTQSLDFPSDKAALILFCVTIKNISNVTTQRMYVKNYKIL